MSDNLDENSQIAYQKAVQNLKNYLEGSFQYVDTKIMNFNSIPKHQKNYLSTLFFNRIDLIKEAIKSNQKFFDAALLQSKNIFGVVHASGEPAVNIQRNKHIESVLRQVYREWSVEGKCERDKCYGKIVDIFCKIYDEDTRKSLSVLVPGSGLGRLVYDLALTGCQCIHNEDDMNMLIVSYGLMNNLHKKESFIIYPWVNEWCHNYGGKKYLCGVKVPDVEINPNVNMVAWAGDFHTIFEENHYSKFDCIATCFFLDTSINVISLIEKIHLLLKPGGVWINIGPLVYHYSDELRYNSIEPTYEELQHVIFDCLKFEAVFPIEFVDCDYFYNSNSMHRFYYNCPFFAAKK